MIENLLEARLKPVWRRRLARDMIWSLAACWTVASGISAVVLLGFRVLRWSSPLLVPLLVGATVGASAWVVWRTLRRRPNLRALAQELESADPELNGKLATALEQKPSTDAPLNFLQQRLILDAVEASFHDNWNRRVSPFRLGLAAACSIFALAAWLSLLLGLRPAFQPGSKRLFVRVADLEVTPGNVELERGTSLVILARFGNSIPESAELVLRPANGTAQSLPLTRSLGDPVFGGTVPDVTGNLTYQVQAGGRKSPEYQVRVFEYPRLARSDAHLTYPAYTHLDPKRLEDTRRISAVEGTRLDLGLQLNKPVQTARLIARGGTNDSISLTLVTNQAQAHLGPFELQRSGTYDLLLVDADGRSNKTPAQFVFDVTPNRTPELKLAMPRGDQTPSALQEVRFDGTVWDDFGVLTYGIAYARGDQDPVFIPLGTNVPPQEKRTLSTQLALESLGVAPDDLVSWFLWADDLGPDGQVRRTRGDLFFGEIRPFEEVFREGGGGGGGESQQQGQQDGSPTARLADLQKQILNATWKLERERPKARPAQHAKDVVTVTESQSQALDQAREQGDGADDPRAEMMWGTVISSMERALTALVPSTNTTATLTSAVAAERAAYQALLKLREREFQVSRNRNQQRNQGANGGEQMRQRQLDQLDLAENESRYETQREAQAAQGAERQEQLQVLNRLRELARRQEDINERLKELQAQLQAADTEKEREEIRRQLKRLQEEQRQMLADTDELQQRMNRAENQSRFSQEQRQLDQARNDLQRAAEATEQGSPSQALASGTRAQEQLQQMRDRLQKESSNQFSEDLRNMRRDSRELAREQENLGRQLSQLQRPQNRTLSPSSEREALAQQLERQQERLTNLVSRVTQVSQATEEHEPIVSRQLYDTLRQLNQDDSAVVKKTQEQIIRQGQMSRSLYERLQETASNGGEGKALQLMEDLLREGMLPQAGAADQEARQTLARLQRGVEKAAENVLGDDTQALERAQQELEKLASELEQEMTQHGGAAGEPAAESGAPGPSNPQGRPADPTSRNPAQARSNDPNQPGQEPGSSPSAGETAQNDSSSSDSQGSSPSQRQTGPGRPQRPGQANASPGQDRTNTGRGTGRPQGFDSRLLEQLATGADRGRGGSGPILGENYAPWTDRLRDVEEMIDEPGLRSQVATAREQARLARLEFKRENKKPDWAVVRLQVVRPLVEVQQQIREELRRRAPGETLAPIDRDPVASRYAELVRRYYEQLGKE